MAAADACGIHHGFLPHLSSATPGEVSPCCKQRTLSCSNDAPSRPSSGATQPLCSRTTEEQAKREGGKLRNHRMMQRGILASCSDVEGGAAGVREMPILHGDTSGVDASAAAWPSGDRKMFEGEEGVGGETGGGSLAARPSELWNSLIDENNALRRQVSEMKTFLKDHGLVWIGSGPRPGDEGRGDCPTSLELASILWNIQELNDEVAREGRRQVVQTRGGAEFQATRFLQLAFYADGIVVDNGNVRPYAESATKSFIADLRDGFFPAEFKASNPDGLMIHAEDHRAVKSTARPVVRHGKQLHTPFSGTGRRLGGGGKGSPTKRGHSMERGVTEDAPAVPPSLSRGSKVSTLWKGSSSPEESTANCREQRLPPLGGHLNPADDGHFAERRCTKPTVLRVRVAPTDLKMELRMDYQETVEDLWHLIARRVREKLKEEGNPLSLLSTHFRDILECSGQPTNDTNPSVAAFELRLPYPSQEPIDLRQTIREAGLASNASVIFQRREKHTPPDP